MLGEATLDATELNLQLEQLHLARVRGNAHVVERSPELIRRHPADAIAVYLTLVGEAFFYHDDGVRTVRPGHGAPGQRACLIEDQPTDVNLSAARIAARCGFG